MTRLKDSKGLWKLLLGQYVIFGILVLHSRIYKHIAITYSDSFEWYMVTYLLCLLIGLLFAALLNVSDETLKSRLYPAVLVLQMLLSCPLFLWDYRRSILSRIASIPRCCSWRLIYICCAESSASGSPPAVQRKRNWMIQNKKINRCHKCSMQNQPALPNH